MSDRAAYWRRMVTGWERSGLTQAEFCRRRDLTYVTFASWKRKFCGASTQRRGSRRSRGGTGDEPATPTFVEVALSGDAWAKRCEPSTQAIAGSRTSVVASAPGACCEVALPSGVLIRLPADFDVARASQLIFALLRDDPTVARSC